MITIHSTQHSVSNASLSLSSEGLSVTDTVSRDSVTITGLSRVQIAKEIKWWLTFHACSHNEGEREAMLTALIKLQESLTDAINKLSPETEEAAQ